MESYELLALFQFMGKAGQSWVNGEGIFEGDKISRNKIFSFNIVKCKMKYSNRILYVCVSNIYRE